MHHTFLRLEREWPRPSSHLSTYNLPWAGKTHCDTFASLLLPCRMFYNGPVLSAQFPNTDATGANRGDGNDRGSNQPQASHFCGSRNSGSAFPTTSTATKTDCHWRPSPSRLRVWDTTRARSARRPVCSSNSRIAQARTVSARATEPPGVDHVDSPRSVPLRNPSKYLPPRFTITPTPICCTSNEIGLLIRISPIVRIFARRPPWWTSLPRIGRPTTRSR